MIIGDYYNPPDLLILNAFIFEAFYEECDILNSVNLI